jgi:phosphatidylserine/phosphatidylglycerophosphate/cardiolipin synthase-like enzyme
MFKAEYYKEKTYPHANQMIEDLVAARRRGVDVKMILESGEKELERLPNNYPCDYLKENKVPVRFDERYTITHAKLVIIDDKVILGSTNWGHYALDKNHETNVIIDSVFIKNHYEEYFQDLWEETIKC